jgi:hypothetical protein
MKYKDYYSFKREMEMAYRILKEPWASSGLSSSVNLHLVS